MKTCEACWREHNGRGSLCAACNNPGRVRYPKRDSRKENSSERVAHLDMADHQAAADDDGWYYGDDDDE